MAKQIVELFTAFESLGYDWNEFHVYKHPRAPRKYAVWVEGGCSCESYVEPTVEQLEAETPLGKREVYAEFTAWFGRGDYMYGTKIDNLERLRSSL